MNTIENKVHLERVNESFSLDRHLAIREKTFSALERISRNIHVGMWENDAYQMANQILTEMGSSIQWHRTYVRFGENTLKGYHDPMGPNIQLKENDIFYIDIGPVFDGYEGDAGNTYVVGNDEEMLSCKKDVKLIFEKTREYWRKTQCTGQEIYTFAAKLAQDRGWILEMKSDGHRISDFSHQVYCKTKLSHILFTPTELLWVIEIQIRHPKRSFGAFYEDIIF